MLSARMRRNLVRLAQGLPAPRQEWTLHEARTEPPAESVETPEGYLLVRPSVDTLTADEAGLRARLAGVGCALGGRPDGLAVVDIETTGLAGVPLFLVGVLSLGPEWTHIDQHLARRPEEEGALLEGVLR